MCDGISNAAAQLKHKTGLLHPAFRGSGLYMTTSVGVGGEGWLFDVLVFTLHRKR